MPDLANLCISPGWYTLSKALVISQKLYELPFVHLLPDKTGGINKSTGLLSESTKWSIKNWTLFENCLFHYLTSTTYEWYWPIIIAVPCAATIMNGRYINLLPRWRKASLIERKASLQRESAIHNAPSFSIFELSSSGPLVRFTYIKTFKNI